MKLGVYGERLLLRLAVVDRLARLLFHTLFLKIKFNYNIKQKVAVLRLINQNLHRVHSATLAYNDPSQSDFIYVFTIPRLNWESSSSCEWK